MPAVPVLELVDDAEPKYVKYNTPRKIALSANEKKLLNNPKKEKIREFIYSHAKSKTFTNPIGFFEDMGEEILEKKIHPETLKQKATEKTQLEIPVIMLHNIQLIENAINMIINTCCNGKLNQETLKLDVRTSKEMIEDNMKVIKDKNIYIMEKRKQAAIDLKKKLGKSVPRRIPKSLTEVLPVMNIQSNEFVKSMISMKENIRIWKTLEEIIKLNQGEYSVLQMSLIEDLKRLFDYSRNTKQPGIPRGLKFTITCIFHLLFGYYINIDGTINISPVISGYDFGELRLKFLMAGAAKKVAFIKFFSDNFNMTSGEVKDILTSKLNEKKTLSNNLPIIVSMTGSKKFNKNKKTKKKGKGKGKGKKLKTIKR